MAEETTPEQLREQLREIDAEIAQLKQSMPLGPGGDGVEDAEEIAADLTSVEEQRAVLGILERRRESIMAHLVDGG